jgi:hypothetical protein
MAESIQPHVRTSSRSRRRPARSVYRDRSFNYAYSRVSSTAISVYRRAVDRYILSSSGLSIHADLLYHASDTKVVLG